MGDLTLVKTNKSPLLQGDLSRAIKLHTGFNGIIIVAQSKFSFGGLVLIKLCPLPSYVYKISLMKCVDNYSLFCSGCIVRAAGKLM